MNLQEKLQSFLNTPREEPVVNKNDKVLLVDGTNNYIRAFAATPTMNDDGEHWGGFTGFLKSIGMIIRDQKPSRVILVFDGRGGSQRRRTMYAGYKGNRRSMQRLNRSYDFGTPENEIESQRKQLHELVSLCKHLPVTIMGLENVEADDVLAYLTQVVTTRGGKSIIVSTDKDFLQLIDANVRVYNPIKKKMYTPERVVEEYGIHPNNFLIYRVMDGDKSDNVTGIKGIGKATLLKQFPTLKDEAKMTWSQLYELAEQSTSSACKKILENKSTIEQNVELMKLDEPQISGHARAKVVELFDKPINSINKAALIQQLVHVKLVSSFGDIEKWIQTTFVPLNRFSNKD
jgi:DNA polymerase-1